MKKVLASLTVLLFILTGLLSNVVSSSAEDKVIRIGVTSVSNITYEAIKEEYEKLGYQTEAIMFDTNPVLLEAVNAGDIDISLGQHQVFMNNFNETRKGDLEMVRPYGYYTGIGLYSEKYNAIEEIPDGAQVAIMNDAMNMNVALRILEDAGFIKIREDIDNATIADITENPKNLQIIDVEQQQTVSALKDMDAATVFFTHMSNAGLDPSSFLVRDSIMITFPMGPIVKKDNAKEKWALDYAECFKLESVQERIEEELPGVFEFYEDDTQAEPSNIGNDNE